VATA
jgi:hypothetical protein